MVLLVIQQVRQDHSEQQGRKREQESDAGWRSGQNANSNQENDQLLQLTNSADREDNRRAEVAELDIAFNGRGTVLTSFGAKPADARALAIQRDGRLLVGGSLGLDAMIFLQQCVDGRVHRAGSPDFATKERDTIWHLTPRYLRRCEIQWHSSDLVVYSLEQTRS